MSFFKAKDDRPDKWKEKYFDLLDSHERMEKDYQTDQALLCKIIIRFALAVKGFNTALDPHLDRIREALKAGVKSLQLQMELEIFSNALMTLEDPSGSQHPNASLLFDYLGERYPEHAIALDALHVRYDKQEFANVQSLFSTLAETLKVHTPPLPNDFASQLALTDGKAISQQMLRLLDNADLPELFLEQGKALKIRIESGHSVGQVFQEAIDLLLNIKKHMQVEQQEMADFLSSLTEQLAELGLKTADVNLVSEDAKKKRQLQDRDVAEQMADLQKKSATATQLEPLKQLIGIRLQGIGQQMQIHAHQEQLERENTHRELRSLLQKIREMEAETTELKTRLDAAQRRAMRDPLTNLPNRLAFEERLRNEISRAERYGGRFSLAIWDIDFFKTINDSYGHKSGDKALTVIAKLLSEHCRESDFVARLGGEEFVMLLPETETQSALIIVNKLRDSVERSSFNVKGEKVSITLSCGLTQYRSGDDQETIFVRADRALYQAKHNGRNQCIAA